MDDGDGALGISTFEDGTVLISYQNQMVEGEYYVTAVAGDKESGFSKPVETLPLSTRLPSEMAENILFENYATVDDLPESIPVMFIDGSVANRKMVYETEGITIPEFSSTVIKHTVEGTAFLGYVEVDSITKEELAALSSTGSEQETNGYVPPQNKTDHVPAPNIPTIITDAPETEEPAAIDSVVAAQKKNTDKNVEEGNTQAIPVPTVVSDVPINADSAVEEYLALNLIDGKEEISLKAFPEAQNFDTITDVLGKVVYQNPLILGVKQYGYDYGSLTLEIKYEYAKEEIIDMQEDIAMEASNLVTTIFKAGMSEEDKHLALYNYLNDNTKYDDAALADAEKNNFVSTDPKFNDSFNIYGNLVNKVGVCASYAATYKMLSDLAGLESVVVTGEMNGIPHAWNKIKIKDNWVHVDATNNATNSGIPYLLYNSSDETAESLNFFADKDYWLDTELGSFEAKDSSLDYYVVNDLVVESPSDMTSRVSDLLIASQSDVIVVRVIAELSDTDLQDSLIKAFDKAAISDLSNVQVGELGTYLVIEW